MYKEIGNIEKLDIHHLTDEVFILMKGKAVLIGAAIQGTDIEFKIEKMKPNITYNIPVNTWHNIAMSKDCEIIIIEKSETHIADFEFFPLSSEKKKELETLVKQCFEVDQ